MNAVDQLIAAAWVIPGEPAGVALENHALALAGSDIAELLPTAAALDKYPGIATVTLGRHALLPGLVNAHGHACMSLLRGRADDLPFKTWLEEAIWPLEQRLVTEDFVHDGTLLACAEMIRSGTTCFADMYLFPDEVAKAAIRAGIRVQLAAPVADFPTVWAQDADEYLRKAIAVHDEFAGHSHIATAFGPHAPYTVNDTALRRLASLAEELDLPIHMHVHETAAEVREAVAKDSRRPLHRLFDLGLATPRLLCVHATQLEGHEMDALASCGTHVVHCPRSNLKLATGFCEVAKLTGHGVNVALGTDGAASNNNLNMLDEMRTAALLAKAVAGDAAALPAAAALAMATINGAKALALENEIGSLTAGKRADIIAMDLARFNTMPLFDPLSAIVYAGQSDQVSHVWCHGRPLLADGELLTLDGDVIAATVRRWQERVTAAGAGA